MSVKRIDAEWPELDGVAYTQLSPEEYSLARACVHALRGLSDDALTGGWNYAGMNAYALKLEAEVKGLRLDLTAMTAARDALNLEVNRLRKEMRDNEREFQREARAIADEARWEERQRNDGDYGSY